MVSSPDSEIRASLAADLHKPKVSDLVDKTTGNQG
jgi:hypothetical protein